MAHVSTEQTAGGKTKLRVRGKTEERRGIQLVLVNPKLFDPGVVEWRRSRAMTVTSRGVVPSIVVVVKVFVVVVVVMLVLSLRAAREGRRVPVIVGGPKATAIETVILKQQRPHPRVEDQHNRDGAVEEVSNVPPLLRSRGGKGGKVELMRIAMLRPKTARRRDQRSSAGRPVP